jgi:hypothetical protein
MLIKNLTALAAEYIAHADAIDARHSAKTRKMSKAASVDGLFAFSWLSLMMPESVLPSNLGAVRRTAPALGLAFGSPTQVSGPF